jgi:hypothetical protein
MKHKLGSLTIEAIDTYVRVTVSNFGGPGAPDKVAVTKQQCPDVNDVASLVAEMRGYWPDAAVLQACGRAADNAKDFKIAFAI